jgi:DNA-binding NarL/FixJ family response regulator
MESEITIILADDHPIFRQGLRQVIENEPRCKVLAEASDGRAALDLMQTLKPAVAVLDLDMPELDGFSVARRAGELALSSRIIILTMHKDELHVNQAIDLKVAGYVIKDGAATEVVDCIRTVARNGEYFSPSFSSLLLSRSRRTNLSGEQGGITDLTPTERRILLLLAKLITTKEIAAELGISPRTVDNHRTHICSKLGLQGSHALVKFALQHKADLS